MKENHVEPTAQEVEDHGWKHQDGGSENDRHDTGIIDAQGHKRTAAGVGLASHDALGVLDGDLALSLGHGHHAGNDRAQEEDQGDKMEGIKASRLEHIRQALSGLGQTSEN